MSFNLFNRLFSTALHAAKPTAIGLLLIYGQSSFGNPGGGIGTGGGSFIPGTEVTTAQVKEALSEITPVIYARFNFIEMALGNMTHPGLKPLREKLFQNRPSIFEILPKATLKQIENGPCYDNRHAPKDGSAIPEQATICISVKEATAKLTTDNLFPQLVAIAIHELGHLSGLNENQARILQTFALTNSTYNDDLVYLARYATFTSHWTAITRSIESLIQSKDFSRICDVLDDLNYETAVFSDFVKNDAYTGMSVLRPQSWIEASVLSLRTRHANNFCKTTSKRTETVNMAAIHPTEFPLTLELYRNIYITSPANGDEIGLQKALSEIQSGTGKIAAELESIKSRKPLPTAIVRSDSGLPN